MRTHEPLSYYLRAHAHALTLSFYTLFVCVFIFAKVHSADYLSGRSACANIPRTEIDGCAKRYFGLFIYNPIQYIAAPEQEKYILFARVRFCVPACVLFCASRAQRARGFTAKCVRAVIFGLHVVVLLIVVVTAERQTPAQCALDTHPISRHQVEVETHIHTHTQKYAKKTQTHVHTTD